MIRDSARQMLQAIPRRMAQGGEAGSFSDDEVSKFIQDTYAQFGGPGVEAHRVIADAMAQFGVGVNQVARVSGFTPREVEAEFMGQRAGEAPALDDPTGTAAGMSAAYRAAAQAGGQQTVDDYYANLRADAAAYLANPNAPTGVDAYNQLIQSGISTSDLRNAGVADEVLNKIFTVSGPIDQSAFVTPTGMTSAYERSPDLSFEAQRLSALGQDGRGILDQQGREYIANLQQGGIDAAERAQMLEYATERGYTFDDLIGAGVDPNVLFRDDGSAAAAAAAAEAERKRVADIAAAEAAELERQRLAREAADKAVVAPGVTTGDLVAAVTPTYNATQLQAIINAAGAAAPAAGTVANPIDTRGSAATGSQSGVSKFLETYNPPAPFVAPAYTAPTVYQPLPAQPDIFAPGEVALDEAFRASSPRTAIPGMPGQFDYTPAAKLRPATGSGFSFTPPSVTSRPRSLLSPLTIQGYGGTLSASQRFAQNRALIDRNLRDMLSATPALRNASTYNLLRNQVMSGRFGPDPNRVFDPETNEGQQFQAYLASLSGAAPTAGVVAGTGSPIAAGGGVPFSPEIDGTDRQFNAAGIGSNVVGGADPGGFGGKSLVYGGYGDYPLELFNKGGEVSSSRRMLENLSGKKSEGSARDGLARFAEGGIATTGRRPLSPDDPLYITEDPAINVDELLRRQLEGIDSAPSARTPERPDPQSESRTMLERLQGAGRFLNQGFYENVSKPAVGAAVDMTLGLGDLAQMGARYVGDKAGMDTGEFRSVAQPVKESLGVEDYNPYTIGGTAAFVLPFAGASRGAQAITGAPSAVSNLTSSAAGQLQSMFPNLARELAAYGGSEAAMLAAQEAAPESTAAQLFAALAGGMGGSFAGSRLGGAGPVSRIDGGDGDFPDDIPTGDAARMLDELDDVVGPTPTVPSARLRRDETQAIDAVVKNRNTRRKLKTEARRIKNNYLPEDGWEPIQVVGIKDNKPRFKKSTYGYQNPPTGVDENVWRNQLTDNIVNEVDDVVRRAQQGDQAAVDILSQANWYRSMRNQLRSEFGGMGDVFADVLGTTSAQTNVEQNFNNAVEIMRRYSRGEFDNELNAYKNRVKEGLTVDNKTLQQLHNLGEFPLITKASGKLFGANSPSSMGALLNTFRSIEKGSAPKTPNFTGNLIGLTNEATIDVWAARMLRRLSGRSRIPPVAEQGVSGNHMDGSTLFDPKVDGEFGFGQDVFRDAAERINNSGSVRSVAPDLGDLGPDDLQAVAWFIEKERWTNNGWTTKAGEGGSLDYEMSFAGAPDQDKIYNLRRNINKGFSAPKRRKKETDEEYAIRLAQARVNFEDKRDLMQAELSIAEAPLQRYQLGISGEIRGREGVPDKLMSGYEQAELAAPFDDLARNDTSVLGYNLANSYGSFNGFLERALNAEFVVRQNFIPDALLTRLIEQGKFYDQDAVFLSKIVSAESPNARPGVEIYYKNSVTPEQLASITARLRAKGIDGFTYVTDMRFDDRINRQTRSGDPETATLTGLRFQYVPEFDELFDPAKRDEIYAQRADLFDEVVRDIVAQGEVSDARLTFHDTQVYFRDQYDDYLRESAPVNNPEGRGKLAPSSNGSQSNRGREGQAELPESVRDRLSQATGSSPQEGINSPSQGARPVNEQLGIDRAKSMVEESGYRWNDVKQITTPEEYTQFQRRYGLASAVSERDEATDVFGRGGAMFYDDVTGAPVAYATSSAAGKASDAAEGFARGGPVTSSRRMLDSLSGINLKGQHFAEGGEALVGGSAPAVFGRMGRSARMAAQRAEDPQSESRTMLERLGRFTSLDNPQDMGLGEIAADIGMGFLPVVGTAQGARDFERARRDEDKLGMLLSAASMIPVAGGAVRAARSAKKAADAVEEVPGAARQMLDDYRGSHQSPTSDGGAPLNDLTMLIPEDVYSPAGPRLYGIGDPEVDREAFSALRSVRGKPEAEVTVYRAVPENVSSINDGDWVTTSRKYADMHGERSLGGNYKIIEQKAKAKDLFSEGYPYELGYSPSVTPIRAVPTQTPEFKNWFGDSKVVDADGKPLRVFHGTVADFDVFKRTRVGEFGPAIYTTDSADEAFQYAVGSGSRSIEQAPVKTMPVYVSLQNPYTEGVDAYWKRFGRDKDGNSVSDAIAQENAIAAGFDGVIAKRLDSGNKVFTHYVAFDPTQIKSAVGNVGTFDPSTPVITKAKGGPVTKKAKSNNVERVAHNDNRKYL